MSKLLKMLVVCFGFILLTACGGSGSSADSCALECEIDLESYSIIIPCESGAMMTTTHGESTETTYAPGGGMSGMKKTINQTRTYSETNNSYEIAGFIEISGNDLDYEITVTGGVYGDSAQVCTP